MKSTDVFKQTVLEHLQKRASDDALFAACFAKPEKKIDDCITYILNTVQKSGCVGFTDSEVFSMAVHYYDEDSIEVGKPINAKVIVNHSIDLTEEDKASAKQQAMDNLIRQQQELLHKKPVKVKPQAVELPSLF